jgi:hypothetical protein
MKLRILLLTLILVVAACSSGSDDNADGGGDTQPDVTQTTGGDGGSGDNTTVPSDGGGGDGPSAATVTIGDDTYEFSTEGAMVAQCLTDLFGVFSVQLPMANDGDGSLSLIILHPDTDPDEVGQTNSVEVDIGDVTWIADPENLNIAGNPDVPVGQSQVISAEIDGNTVRGTLALAGSQTIYSADFVEFAEGTFEATCGEERTS